MPTILLLALAAAVYPQLLAVVVIILTRPNPKLLLWACYLGSVAVGISASFVIVSIFRLRETIAGTSSQRLGPAAYLVTGAIALVVAILAATPRGRALVRGTLVAVRSRGQRGSTRVARMHSRAEVGLREGSLAIAFLVGVLLGIPGPFDLVALGHVARGSYGAIGAAGLILAFILIKFVLIEAPIVSYAIDPDGTAAKVNRFSSWMKANKFAIAASVVGLIGVGLLVRGISGLG